MSTVSYAEFRRAFDRYSADPIFRKAADAKESMPGDDGEAVYRAVHSILYAQPAYGNIYFDEFVRRQDIVAAELEKRKSRETDVNENLFRYEQLERNRAATECARIRAHKYISYYPFAIELSDGCRVQCPFCGLAAEKHKGDFLYTLENEELFVDVVKVALDLIGPIINFCPLYFATEPLDNPDYAKFLKTYSILTGGVPQTTTAVADTAHDKVREMIKLVGETGFPASAAFRFSVRNLSQFECMMREYSPRETEYIELLANNPESVNAYSDSGKAQCLTKSPKKLKYSICCISGLLVNFPKHTVSFITPEMPDEVYPKGYRILETRTFFDSSSFRVAAEELLKRYVSTEPGKDEKMCLNRNTILTEDGGWYIFKGDGVGYRIQKNAFTDRMIRSVLNRSSFSESFENCRPDPEGESKLYEAYRVLFTKGYIRRYFAPMS